MNRSQFNESLEKLERAPAKKKVLLLVLAGHIDTEIAVKTNTKEGTVRKQISKIYESFGIKGEYEGDRRPRRDDLVAQFRKYKPEWVSDFPAIVKNEVSIAQTAEVAEQEGAIAKPHRESGSAIDASASDINSERYNELERLLTAKQWQEANEETRTIMLNIASREIEGSLRALDINKLPCQDLHTIDKLWVEYSNRHFGFSVQKRIWKDVVKSRSNPNYRTLCRFGECVGWHMNGSWLSCPDLSFTGNSAPVGHLPATFFIIYGNLLLKPYAYLEGRFETQAEHGSRLSASCFFSRIETCKL